MASDAGRLYVCATPIGNLGDVTFRTVEVLRTVACIAAEDTRHTRKLLDHLGIDTPLTSLHEHNESVKAPGLVARMLRGDSVALVSDAGTPLLSDPGFQLVQSALAAGVTVVPVPGASALLTALVGSGLPAYPFYFGGFLPRKQSERRARLESLRSLDATLVFYEVPHRLRAALADLAQLYPERRAVVARELTKVHEEFVRGTTAELARSFAEREPRGECVLVIEGAPRTVVPDDVSDDAIGAALLAAMETARDKKEAIRTVASFMRVDRKRVYRIAVELAKRGREP